MDKVSLIKHEAEKFVALSKKNKQELQDIGIEQDKLNLVKEDLAKKLCDLEDKKNDIIRRQDEVRSEIAENKELRRENIDHLKSIKEKEKKLEIERKRIDQDNRDIVSEKLKIKAEKLNIENIKSVERATKELIVKQDKLKDNLGSLEAKREQLKEDKFIFQVESSGEIQKLRDFEHNLGLRKNELEKNEKNLVKQKQLQDKRAKELLDQENAIETKLNILKDKDADIASRELDLGNFIKRLKKEHGLKKLKKEGLL